MKLYVTNYDRALARHSRGGCPFPYLRAPAAGDVGLGKMAKCFCGKLVRVTVRGLYAHHNPNRPVTIAEMREMTGRGLKDD